MIAIIILLGLIDQEICNCTDESEEVLTVINSSISWASTKDTVQLFNCFIKDSSLFFFNPESGSEVHGFDEFAEFTRKVFMNPSFKAIGYEIDEMRLSFSKSCTVAWFSCKLDDYNEWDGQPFGWINCRWTGVLEKYKGSWKIVQMHFSLPSN